MREIDFSKDNPEARLTGALRSLADASHSGAPPVIGEALTNAFRRHHARRRFLRRIAVSAAMATMLLPGALWLAQRHPVEQAVSKPPQTAFIAPSVKTAAAAPASTVVSRPRGKKLRTKTAAKAQRLVAGDFVVLSSYDQPERGEELRIIRLEVTGSALRKVGAPVMEQKENRTVLADFVVGQDGTPYAMRLVR